MQVNFEYRTLRRPMTCSKCGRRMGKGEIAVGRVGKGGKLEWVRCWEDFTGYFWLNYTEANIQATLFNT